MRAKVKVIAEGVNEFDTKKGKRRNFVLSCLDQCASRQWLKNTFDVEVPSDDMHGLEGKTVDHVLEVDLTNAQFFNQRIVFKDSKIFSYDGKPVLVAK